MQDAQSPVRAQLEREMPRLWIRTELYRLSCLLETNASLALELGADPQLVIEYLKRVRIVALGGGGL